MVCIKNKKGLRDMPIRYILTDIEGTTTAIDFVHKVLFPYSRERLPSFVEDHLQVPEVQDALRAVLASLRVHGALTSSEVDRAVKELLSWIDQDRKHPALKTLQGLIWEQGYRQKAYQSHIYPDVPAALRSWQAAGICLGVYSSGSVQAQKLLFAHTAYGDLTGYFKHFFDTGVGAKKEAASYSQILQQLSRAPSQVLFLTDVREEAEAAAETGLKVVLITRKGDKEVSADALGMGGTGPLKGECLIGKASDFFQVDAYLAQI
jgi:enolase-phosphatase E1